MGYPTYQEYSNFIGLVGKTFFGNIPMSKDSLPYHASENIAHMLVKIGGYSQSCEDIARFTYRFVMTYLKERKDCRKVSRQTKSCIDLFLGNIGSYIHHSNSRTESFRILMLKNEQAPYQYFFVELWNSTLAEFWAQDQADRLGKPLNQFAKAINAYDFDVPTPDFNGLRIYFEQNLDRTKYADCSIVLPFRQWDTSNVKYTSYAEAKQRLDRWNEKHAKDTITDGGFTDEQLQALAEALEKSNEELYKALNSSPEANKELTDEDMAMLEKVFETNEQVDTPSVNQNNDVKPTVSTPMREATATSTSNESFMQRAERLKSEILPFISEGVRMEIPGNEWAQALCCSEYFYKFHNDGTASKEIVDKAKTKPTKDEMFIAVSIYKNGATLEDVSRMLERPVEQVKYILKANGFTV